jgi:hypothetical protein
MPQDILDYLSGSSSNTQQYPYDTDSSRKATRNNLRHILSDVRIRLRSNNTASHH